MKLLIISHTPHYLDQGSPVGWGPTVREIDQLAEDFESITHVAALHPGPAPGSCLAYRSPRVMFRPVRPAGGRSLSAKLGILRALPSYASAISRELKKADVVHVRCPANISLTALVLLSLARRPAVRWVKYAGNWRPTGREAWSYACQRWWLRNRLHRGVVTVNGDWDDQPSHVFPFFNPCLTDAEVERGREAALAKELRSPLRLLYVGRLDASKGAGRAVQIWRRLQEDGVSAELDLIGDGPLREELAGAEPQVRCHGWLTRQALEPFYADAHIMLLPTASSEGWPKVLSEAMAFGVVPVAGRVSSIPGYLQRLGCGRAIDPEDIDGFVGAIREYQSNEAAWRSESLAGCRAAPQFTYSRYRQAVKSLLAQT
jgi:glycosyltransferase involved in cell wall biosynthesis